MPLAIGRAPRLLVSREGIRLPCRFKVSKSGQLSQQRTHSTNISSSGGNTQQGEGPLEQGSEKAINLESRKQLAAEFGSACIPHPEKASYGGEDAFFVSPVGGGAFGVADGVGGWQESGINPAEYSRTFMRLACAFLEGKEVGRTSVGELPVCTSSNSSLLDQAPSAEAETAEGFSSRSPQAALKVAHDGTRLPGSSTACIMRVDRAKNVLSAANVGDSGFLIIREGAVAFRSPALQHFFDCPLQFAAYPDYTNATDNAEDAGLYQLPIQQGDLIVAGTDGLWDNVYQEEMIEVLQQYSQDMQKAAVNLAKIASDHANDRKYPSPYTQEARKQGIDLPWILRLANASFTDGKFKLGHMKGGKLDDITVVTARITEVEIRPASIPETADQESTQTAASPVPQAASPSQETVESLS